MAIRASQAGGNKVKWKDIKKLGDDPTEYCRKFMFKSLGYAGAQLDETGRSGVRLPMESLGCFIDLILLT